MACKTSYELHHNFPKIADEAGFTFNTHRPRIRIDWNKIRLIDVENVIRERKFVLIEQHLNDILDCILESEFDVRILDEGVLKMFRLAQLSVEYQQFCRHYLDRSVYVLREEINSLAQELDVTKKELKDRDEEVRKLKRKSKQTYRTPLPYGNDNIANMILKTLTNKSDFFPNSNTGDAIQYNRCGYCDKIFMNQLYLQSHISRRHPQVKETPQKDVEETTKSTLQNIENNKLSEEVLELKHKLKEMEDVIRNFNKQEQQLPLNHNNNKTPPQVTQVLEVKQVKDAEVSTNSEFNLLDKIEAWKKEEHDKHNNELNMLKNQIIETIQSLKTKESPTNQFSNNDLKVIDELNKTITKQGTEILQLKQELIDSRLKIEKEEQERRKENEVQMLQWANRAENSAKQYELLLQKLNEVAKEARESRAQADAERERVAQLEAILQEKIVKQSSDVNVTKISPGPLKKTPEVVKPKPVVTKKSLAKPSPEASRQTLEKLHQKAQALLNIQSTSSSSSDISSTENVLHKSYKSNSKKHNNLLQGAKNKNSKSAETIDTKFGKKVKVPNHTQQSFYNYTHKSKDQKNIKNKHQKANSNPIKIEKNGIILPPRSPVKVVRAKITEEVNNRLISAGVDPLKSGVPKANYQKLRMKLQQQAEIKAKKNTSHEKVRLSILTYLDSSLPKKITSEPQDYVSPNKISKAFSISSVLSNVKSKALSLVKSNETNAKDKKRSLNAEVAKRAMTLLKTPSDSAHSSPDLQKQLSTTSPEYSKKPELKRYFSKKNNEADKKWINSSPADSSVNNDDDSDTNSRESEHKYYKAVAQETKSIENLIKSPARRPLSANSDYKSTIRKQAIDDEHLLRSQSVTNITHVKPDQIIINSNTTNENIESSSAESSEHVALKEIEVKDATLENIKQTKSVLKNASSTSSLNKKKVLFDMDAIQMKSLSASPSQSITEKSDANEKYELGLINLDGEEWDISSIENEPLKEDTKLQLSTKASPKITELKKTIESQLARRNETPPTAIVGGVDIMPGSMLRASSVGGSNTSLGSSILDDSENMPPAVNHSSFVKPKTIVSRKDDSEIDISEFSADGLFGSKNKNDSF